MDRKTGIVFSRDGELSTVTPILSDGSMGTDLPLSSLKSLKALGDNYVAVVSQNMAQADTLAIYRFTQGTGQGSWSGALVEITDNIQTLIATGNLYLNFSNDILTITAMQFSAAQGSSTLRSTAYLISPDRTSISSLGTPNEYLFESRNISIEFIYDNASPQILLGIAEVIEPGGQELPYRVSKLLQFDSYLLESPQFLEATTIGQSAFTFRNAQVAQ